VVALELRPPCRRPRGGVADTARSVPTLLDGLRDGLRRGEFRLAYQPLVGLADGGVRGAEALVRWEHPVHGLLEPARFVALAERTGAIVPLGRWVLEEACTQAAAWWRERGLAAPFVSVNVSPPELTEPGWVDGVARVIDITGVPPAQVQLEITEQVQPVDERASLAALEAVRALGVRLALDDFGTGWSGLTWLRRFPVQAIKIDGCFVDGLRHRHPDPVDVAIVRGVVRMAHDMGLAVTAEWVETDRQAEYLAELGCDLGQGRWWGGAGPAAWVACPAPRRIG
jgi:EAL domain-containing protein (putative c-di-GMP-specific phosphodiesterase class I)